MAGQIDGNFRTWRASAALAQYVRVKLSSGKLAAAGIGDDDVGTLEEEAFADLDVRRVRLTNASGTRKMVAAGAITSGAKVYQAASGKIDDLGVGRWIGYALGAATGDNSVIEVLTHGYGGGVQGMDLVAAGSALTLTAAEHHGRTIALDTAAGSTITLPAAVGSGAMFRFLVTVAATSNQHRINVVGNDAFFGVFIAGNDSDNTVVAWPTAADADQINMSGTATGGFKGAFITLQDMLPDCWSVFGVSDASGTEATPFATGQVS